MIQIYLLYSPCREDRRKPHAAFRVLHFAGDSVMIEDRLRDIQPRPAAAAVAVAGFDVRRQDEIGVLAASLNEMSERLSAALDSLKTANGQLQQEIEKERMQERQRIDFFTSVSHELKTPIAIIKGELEGMLYKVGQYKDRDTYLRHCLKTAGDMEHIVKEILWAARMGGSGFQLARSDLNLGRMLQEVCRKNSGRMEDQEMKLQMDIQPDFHYEGDGRLMEKVFSNVIGNAAAYSPLGAVITVSLREGVLSVENSGVHIAEEELKQIFTPFYRVDHRRGRRGSGPALLHIREVHREYMVIIFVTDFHGGTVLHGKFQEPVRACLPAIPLQPRGHTVKVCRDLMLQLCLIILRQKYHYHAVNDGTTADEQYRHADKGFCLNTFPNFLSQFYTPAPESFLCNPRPFDPARDQGHAEGLGNVIVRQRVKAFHLAVIVIPGSQHDDGDPAFSPNQLADRETADLRQHQVKEHQIGAALTEFRDPL